MYETHYRSLVRLASLLVPGPGEAESIVQDAYAALHRKRRQLDAESALYQLRQSVVRRSRSVPRRGIAGPDAAGPVPGCAAPGRPPAEHSAVISALGELPARQREAVVLRCYAGLSQAQAASIMGISTRMAAIYLERGLATLSALLDSAGDLPGAGQRPRAHQVLPGPL